MRRFLSLTSQPPSPPPHQTPRGLVDVAASNGGAKYLESVQILFHILIHHVIQFQDELF